MAALYRNVALTVPLFLLVFTGYALGRWGRWPESMWKGLSRFVFAVALPALLFRQTARLPGVPPGAFRVLVAFFGGCLVVFALGHLVARRFPFDPAERSVFALGGVVSNNVLLGVPLAEAALGAGALPTVALVLVFNSLFLWTLATVSVEWARNRSVSGAGLRDMALSVTRNPIVVSILAGGLFGLSGPRLPGLVDRPLSMLADAATPLALVSLGATLVGYGFRAGWRPSGAVTALKLVALPLTVWCLAALLGLSPLETQAVTLLASLSVGVNLFLMAGRFGVLEGPVAASLLLSTGLSAITTPATLTLLRS